jgi:hypothetical protein
MKAMIFVFMIFQNQAVPGQMQLRDRTASPFWTWFIENPRAG